MRMRKFGSIPAVRVIGAYYALVIALPFILDDGYLGYVGPLLLATFAVYCVAKESNRLNTFLLGISPAPISLIAESLFGVSRTWVGLAFMPIALLLVAQDERTAETPRDDGATEPA